MGKSTIYVCMSERCENEGLFPRLQTALETIYKDKGIELVKSGCVGACPFVNGMLVSTDPGDPWDGYRGLSERTKLYSNRATSKGHNLSFEGRDPVDAILIMAMDLVNGA